MPDRDTVNVALKPHYQKAFAQLSEGIFSPDERARNIADPLRKDIEAYGTAPLDLINAFSIELGPHINSPLFKTGVDWHDAGRELLRLARKVHGNKRGIDLAMRACEGQMNRLRSQRDLHSPDLLKETINSYLHEIYLADFADPALLQDSYEDATLRRDDIDAELDAIRPCIDEILDCFAGQVTRNHRVDNLRLPPSKEQPPIDLFNDDLLRPSN